MATVRALMEFGRALAFGLDPSPIVTTDRPAGPPVNIGSGVPVEKWQTEAWRLWDQVGELHYPTCRLSRQTSQLEWRVRVNGRELKPDSAKAEIQAVTAGIGPQEATYLLALNDQVAGEAWYIQTADDAFAVYSVLEQGLEDKITGARRAGRIAIRAWQPDPRNPDKADSSVRTAIGPAEEVLTLQSLSESQARSRISQAGIIVTPAEQLYSDKDPWEHNLVESMQAAIKDVRSASALAPIHIRMRRDLIEFVRYITFPRPYDDLVDRKIERAVIRIANAMDIEPELLQGMGDATYWNAWAISMDTYQAHIAPRADRIGNLYAEVAEQLRAARGQNDVVEITPDPRVMLARRSTARDAFDAFKLLVVGPQYVRDAIGATEADAPTEEEMEWMMQLFGTGNTMDRERRVGENPGPARSNPQESTIITDDFEVARHARKYLGMELQDAWRNTPHRNRLAGIIHHDYICYTGRFDVDAEFDLRGGIEGVVRQAVAEVASGRDVERLTSWIVKTIDVPYGALRELVEVA